MSKFHEAARNVKKAPKKNVKEKRAEKREKREMRNQPLSIHKVFEEKEKQI